MHSFCLEARMCMSTDCARLRTVLATVLLFIIQIIIIIIILHVEGIWPGLIRVSLQDLSPSSNLKSPWCCLAPGGTGDGVEMLSVTRTMVWLLFVFHELKTKPEVQLWADTCPVWNTGGLALCGLTNAVALKVIFGLFGYFLVKKGTSSTYF